ncbi:hypothetical protein K491DRAFT_774510 [Lophiostoma macrostomum CBS 122681]|uniref:BTB domain-containing protein n=1 Tax=Lophiostoma macrostomum CBS 122681 TaxID=1314788 RepID=A0A6A6TKM4_9PLEO|nr:hypothetical protein K491DRAFT_774510 [Lophiostoma macrostomum CBS 122681]
MDGGEHQQMPFGAAYADKDGTVLPSEDIMRYLSPHRPSPLPCPSNSILCPPHVHFTNYLTTQSYNSTPSSSSSTATYSGASPLAARSAVESSVQMEDALGLERLSLNTASSFPPRDPDEFLVIYDKGERMEQVSKAILISHSTFFAEVLGPNPHSPSAPRHKTLKNDHPFTVLAMLHYMHSGTYSWSAIPPSITSRYPRVTEFDFHIGVYLTALKYRAERLCLYARSQYLALFDAVVGNELPRLQQEEKAWEYAHAEELRGGVGVGYAPRFAIFEDGPQQFAWNRSVEARSHAYGNSANMRAFAPTVQTRLFHLCNSVTLLWKYRGAHREDRLRNEVLEGCKTHVVRLCRVHAFVEVLTGLDGFREALGELLQEEGLEIRLPGEEAGEVLRELVVQSMPVVGFREMGEEVPNQGQELGIIQRMPAVGFRTMEQVVEMVERRRERG